MAHTPASRARCAFILAAAFALAGAGSVTAARADDDPAPAVARISVVTGDVGVKHGDADQVAAAINAPLEGGDYVSTGSDGRIEIQLDPNNVVRASSDTQIRFTQLDGSADTVQLAQGTVELRVLQTNDDHISLQTPSVDVVPDAAGAYLVTVDGDGQTFVTARSGSVDVTTPQGSQTLEPGRTMQITGNADNPQYQFIDAVASTDFDQWADGRDQQLTVASVDQNVNPNMLGAQDLDQDGEWTNVSGYGDVWQPNDVPANWSPYSDGTWAYENYYGWTWVGAEPWGWAPYHYGSWVALNSGWAWVPGPADAVPVYAPARVAFFGYGGGGTSINIGLTFGNVGWVPLAPGEPFHKWWGPARTSYVAFGAERYRNFDRGFVGVTASGWQHGNFSQIQRPNPSLIGQVRVVSGRLPFTPTSANYRFTNRTVGATVSKPVYQRFSAIHPIVPSRGSSGPGSSGWQHFTRTQAPASGYAQRATPWQHFGAAQRSGTYTQSPYQRQAPSAYQRQSRSTYQRQYPSYQRQYPSYQRQYSSYQRQTPSYQRQYPAAYRQTAPSNYQRSMYQRPMYQRQSLQRQSFARQRPSGSNTRAPVARGSGGRPRPHGPGTT